MPKTLASRPTMKTLAAQLDRLTADVAAIRGDLRGRRRVKANIADRQVAEATIGLMIFRHNRSAILRLAKPTLLELALRLDGRADVAQVWRWLGGRPGTSRVSRTAFYRFAQHYRDAKHRLLNLPPLLKGDVAE